MRSPCFDIYPGLDVGSSCACHTPWPRRAWMTPSLNLPKSGRPANGNTQAGGQETLDLKGIKSAKTAVVKLAPAVGISISKVSGERAKIFSWGWGWGAGGPFWLAGKGTRLANQPFVGSPKLETHPIHFELGVPPSKGTQISVTS